MPAKRALVVSESLRDGSAPPVGLSRHLSSEDWSPQLPSPPPPLILALALNATPGRSGGGLVRDDARARGNGCYQRTCVDNYIYPLALLL